jgi:OPT oligopeptide transporter protein
MKVISFFYAVHLEIHPFCQVYPEVPMWWYMLVFIASFAMAMATVYTSKSGLPWYVFFVSSFQRDISIIINAI